MRGSSGFSIIELAMVLGLSFVLAGVAVLGFQEAQSVLSANSGEQIVNSKLRLARETAIAQRKNITVSFVEPNAVQVQGNNLIDVETASFPKGLRYGAPSGAPANPDNLAGVVDLRGRAIVFFGDGSARDPGTGNPINGVVFLYDSSNPDASAASAVTLAGSTGRVRTYRYNPKSNNWY
jgi:hypothetical protein